jgi:hypothetical protein
VVVSAATLGDLWYASHRSGPKALAPGAYESLRRTVLDPATNFEVAAIMAETMEYFGRVPLAELADPFDRFIEVFSPGLAVSGRSAETSLQVKPLRQWRIEWRLAGAHAEEP